MKQHLMVYSTTSTNVKFLLTHLASISLLAFFNEFAQIFDPFTFNPCTKEKGTEKSTEKKKDKLFIHTIW